MAKRLSAQYVKDQINNKNDGGKNIIKGIWHSGQRIENDTNIINTAFKGILSYLGIKPSSLNSRYRETDQLVSKAYSLAEKVARDFEERSTMYTPTTGSDYSLQSAINKIYSQYTNEARDIMRLSEQINNDAQIIKDYNNSVLTKKSVTDTASNFIRDDARNIESQSRQLQQYAKDAHKQVNKTIDNHHNKYQYAIQAARQKGKE